MYCRYGEFNSKQIANVKEQMRKQIFFLLLCVDPKTKEEYTNIDVNAAFENLLYKFGGLNNLLGYPTELVNIMSLIDAAYSEYNNPNFSFGVYRKLILDAGNEVTKIKEV